MKPDDPLRPPVEGLGDAAHAMTRGLIGMIPLLGSPAAELFGLIVAPPISNRRDAWMQEVAEGLVALRERAPELSVERLRDDPLFITTLLELTRAAIRTHDTEKLEALCNAVLNSALEVNPDEEVRLQHVQLAADLRPLQIALVRYFHDPSRYVREAELPFRPDVQGHRWEDALELAIPTLKGREDVYYPCILGLEKQELIHYPGGSNPAGILASRTNGVGKTFVEFISKPSDAPT